MKKIINFVKSRAFITTLGLTFIALIIAGITYAWFTWSSTDNTNITMQIGEYTVVTFTEGNDINVNNLAPVYNYIDGESTTFTLTNNNDDVTKEFKYNVYLDVTSISNELKTTQFKYVLLDGSSNIIDQGNFSAASNNSTLTITENQSLPNGNSSYTFIIYLDGNEQNNSNIMNKSLSGSLRVTAFRNDVDLNALHVTTADDYEYVLFDQENTEYDKDYILLTKYIGVFPNIQIPDTMIVDGKEYKTVLHSGCGGSGAENTVSLFKNNTIIESVILPNQYLVSSQKNTSSLNLSTTDMAGMFVGCTSLLSISSISNGITSLYSTFDGCTSLVTAPEVPDSVTKMWGTFVNCTSLVDAPVIGNSVSNMQYTFRGCTSLVNAPTIPRSVTNMQYTFMDCTKLTGTIRINSGSVQSFGLKIDAFSGTVKPIVVEVPENSVTYTGLNGKVPDNVTVTTFTP